MTTPFEVGDVLADPGREGRRYRVVRGPYEWQGSPHWDLLPLWKPTEWADRFSDAEVARMVKVSTS